MNNSKHPAAQFLYEELQRKHADQEIIPMWAGDADNDLGMMHLDWRGIVVGNATEKLLGQANFKNSIIGRPRIYISKKRNADGVLDGLGYWKSTACSDP